jgi:hypothetical protein
VLGAASDTICLELATGSCLYDLYEDADLLKVGA